MSFLGSPSKGSQCKDDNKPSPDGPSFSPVLPKDIIDQGPSIPKDIDQGPSFCPVLPKDIDQGPSFGPVLPKDIIDQGPSFGPVLPKDIDQGPSFGPVLPKDIIDQSPSFGPVLPDHLNPSFDPTLPQVQDTFGPTLPPHLSTTTSNINSSSHAAVVQGDDLIGPLPPQLCDDNLDAKFSERNTRKQEVEARSKQMRDKLNPKAMQPVREEWMIELPPEINPNAKAVSMTSRKFRTKYTEVGDRSVWTDMPADKARKAKESQNKQKKKTEEEEVSVSKRERKLADEVEHYNKVHRGQSLVEMHRKRKAEEQPSEKSGERRPFDRDIDLQLPQNVITGAKRKSLIKDSSKSLDNKFTRGKQHYL